jgi:multiple sugar transport system substrate-binding protein
MSRPRLGRRELVAATLGAPLVLGTRAHAAGTIQMISHRYPALEYFAEKMRTAIPGVTVNTQLMPFDKALELITIAMSSKSDTPDIVYASDTSFQTFARNGWLRPLDDLWAKYREEYQLDDFPDSVRKTYTHDGKLYVMPHTVNTMMFFYRKDLFDAAGKQPPKTIADYRELAKSFNSPMRSGSINCLKPVDAAINEAHWYFNALGDGWFDDGWHPVFNDAKGVQSIEMMKAIADTDATPATAMRSPCSASRTLIRCFASSPPRPARRAFAEPPRCWFRRASRCWTMRSCARPTASIRPRLHRTRSARPLRPCPSSMPSANSSRGVFCKV